MELKCLKWVHMTHLDTSNTSYDQKKGQESNCQFDSQPLKVGNHPDFLACKWSEIYHWKYLNKGYTLLETSFQSEVCMQSYGPLKSRESQLWEFRNSHLGISGQNDIWVLVPWPSIEYTIRGKVVASPKFGPWWVLWVRVYSWFVRAPKCSNYALTNLLFGLCRSVWISDVLINLLNPISELQHATLPWSVVNQGARSNSLSLCCFHLWTRSWVHWKAWGCVTDARVALEKIINRILDICNTNEGWVVKKMRSTMMISKADHGKSLN